MQVHISMLGQQRGTCEASIHEASHRPPTQIYDRIQAKLTPVYLSVWRSERRPPLRGHAVSTVLHAYGKNRSSRPLRMLHGYTSIEVAVLEVTAGAPQPRQ